MLIARIGDTCSGICSHPSHIIPLPMIGKIISGSSKTMFEGRGAARIGDVVMTGCGHTGNIVTGSSALLCEGSPIAKVGDKVAGFFVAVIISGSEKSGTSA